MTVDHIIKRAWAKGFNPNAPENIQVLCVLCHRTKYNEEQKVQDDVMMGKISVAEAFDHLRQWQPGAVMLRKIRQAQIPVSKWEWQRQRSFYLKAGAYIMGVTFFGKKSRGF